jgi:hypothetical protein
MKIVPVFESLKICSRKVNYPPELKGFQLIEEKCDLNDHIAQYLEKDV